MTDQTIPADKVRRALDDPGLSAADVVEAIRELLPPPPRPTLADMSPDDRLACMWMQCDVEGSDGEWVVADPSLKECFWRVISEVVGVRSLPTSTITPRPDLPRLEWPGDKTAPAGPTGHALPDGFRLAEHPDYGRVIVTTPDPGCDGDVYFVYPETDLSLGFNSDWCDSAALTFLDQEADQ